MKTMENTEAYVQAPPQPRRNSFFDIAADQKQPNHQELTRQARNDQLGDNEKASKKYRKTKKSNKKKHRDKRKKNPHRLTSPGAQKRSLDKEKRRRKLQNAVTFVGLDNINTVNGDVEGEYRETEEAAEVKKPLAGLKLEHPLEEDPESIPLYKRIFSCWYSDLVHLEDLGMTLEQIEIVKMMSPFSEMELRRMAKRFLELDDSKTGDITMAEYVLYGMSMEGLEEFGFLFCEIYLSAYAYHHIWVLKRMAVVCLFWLLLYRFTGYTITMYWRALSFFLRLPLSLLSHTTEQLEHFTASFETRSLQRFKG